MSDASRSTPDPALPLAGSATSASVLPSILRTLTYCILAGVIAVVVYVAYRVTQDQAAMKLGQNRLVALHGVIAPARKSLAPGFADKDGRMLADPPSDAAKLIDPARLVLAHYEGDDVDAQRVDWTGFQAHLARATGRELSDQVYLNSAAEIAAIKAGEIHLVAVHAADTPYLVNNVGFRPVAVLGTEAGASGNHLTLAVGAKSKVASLDDVRGRKLTCTRPDSITGYRAAIAVLLQHGGMRPDVDYRIHFSHGQSRSIAGLVNGEFEVAALSNDKLRELLARGEIKESDYRVIYESQVIPRLTIGYVYNLRPELADKVTEAILSFPNDGAAADESTGKPMRYFAIDYKKDFAFVRTIDDSFDPRFGKTPKTDLTP